MVEVSHHQHANPKTDIEIAQAADMVPIRDVALDKLGIDFNHLEPYGHHKAKLSIDFISSLKEKKDGKLILVTAISPTPAGKVKQQQRLVLVTGLTALVKRLLFVCVNPASVPASV